MTRQFKGAWLSIWIGFLLAFANPAYAEDEPVDAKAMNEASASVASEVEAEADKATAERRQKIIQGAVEAIAHTKNALTALEEERIDDALEALALTTGKLELIVAREPELALAPTDVAIITRDLYATPAAIQMAIDRAEDALANGKVQGARHILDGLGSELVFSVTNLPLATYPDAIKAITPLIDDGKIEEAKQSLHAVLNTLVVTDHIVPLPVLRSEALLERAEELAEKSDRTNAENGELSNKLAAVRNQLEMAELLGYGDDEDFERLYAQLDDIEEKTEDGKSGEGFFDRLKSSMSELWGSIFS